GRRGVVVPRAARKRAKRNEADGGEGTHAPAHCSRHDLRRLSLTKLLSASSQARIARTLKVARPRSGQVEFVKLGPKCPIRSGGTFVFARFDGRWRGGGRNVYARDRAGAKPVSTPTCGPCGTALL